MFTRAGRQLVDDIELGDGQVEVDAAPVSAAQRRAQQQRSLLDVRFPGRLRRQPGAQDQAHALRQDRNAARLVDEVDRAALKRLDLTVRAGHAGQDDDGDRDAVPPQKRHELDARDRGQVPVEQQDVRRVGAVEVVDGRGTVGKVGDREAVVHQLGRYGFAIVVIVVHQQKMRCAALI